VIIPLAIGAESNYQAAHRTCNIRKGGANRAKDRFFPSNERRDTSAHVARNFRGCLRSSVFFESATSQELAAADREILELAVKVKKESTYHFATCGVCGRNWYAWDAPPKPA